MQKEIIRLFKSYLEENKSNIPNQEALEKGIIIPNNADKEIIDYAIERYGINGYKFNQTFHKSFQTVRELPLEELIVQQIIHYCTTYGFEDLGIYDKDTVYIPAEKLEIPEVDLNEISLTAIKPITEKELQERLMKLLTSGIALSEETVEDIMALSDYIDKNEFDKIKNREIKIALYKKYNVMPQNPEEFLKYMIYELTGNILKIKNVDTWYSIKNCDKEKAYQMFNTYIKKNGIAKLSSIFLRNKYIFLAFKTNKDSYMIKDYELKINSIINKLRKLANKNHVPMTISNLAILDRLTDKNVNVDLDELYKMLDNITIYREIRIYNGVTYRILGNDNIVYRIRNGKSYVKTLPEKDMNYMTRLINIQNIIKNHLVNRISDKVAGKVIYIPENVVYSAPTSEKQFSDNIPDGSYIEVPRNGKMVYGVHWENLDGDERVDLDLKQMNKSEVFGWNAAYRGHSVTFSGDVVDAPKPKGATELFEIDSDCPTNAYLVTLNMYTSNSKDVPYEFIIAESENYKTVTLNYVVNPNKVKVKLNRTIKNTERQKVVGFITIEENKIRFYFNDFTQGKSQSTSQRDEYKMGAFDYYRTYTKTQLKLNDLLKEAGADIVTTKKVVVPTIAKGFDLELVEKQADIDLSLEAITKETIIDLLQ